MGGIYIKILLSGGCKNGKSFYAQRVCRALGGNLYYIATMIPSDAEDDERIERHKKDREGWGFKTIEQPRNIERAKHVTGENATALLDSLTALMANEMFNPNYTEGALEKVCRELINFSNSVENIIVVSDYIYSDASEYGDLTERYRKSLALAERELAACFDAVVEISHAGALYHKGGQIEIC